MTPVGVAPRPGTVRAYDRGMSSDAVPEAGVPVQLDPQLDGQLSVNDILLELARLPWCTPRRMRRVSCTSSRPAASGSAIPRLLHSSFCWPRRVALPR